MEWHFQDSQKKENYRFYIQPNWLSSIKATNKPITLKIKFWMLVEWAAILYSSESRHSDGLETGIQRLRDWHMLVALLCSRCSFTQWCEAKLETQDHCYLLSIREMNFTETMCYSKLSWTSKTWQEVVSIRGKKILYNIKRK